MRGRGAKGSIKDRLLSILYKIRYNKYLKKKERYYKKNKIKLVYTYKSFFKKYKIKLIKVIPKKNIKARKVYKSRRKKHVGIAPTEPVLNKNKIKNVKILYNKNISQSVIKNQIYKIIINKQEFNIKINQFNKLKKEETKLYISNINTKLKPTKRKFKRGIGVNQKSIKLDENYKKISSVLVNKKVTHKIINKKRKKGVGVNTKFKLVKDNKYKILKTLKVKQEKVHKIENIDEKIKKEIEEQKKILEEMKAKVSKVEVISKKTIKLSGFSRIISSILKIATGLLTLPFTGSNIFGVMLGATLVNKGIRGIRKGLDREEITTINYNYEDLKYKILKSKDKIGDTKLLLTDSLEQIKLLKEEFKDKFNDYKVIDPLYNEVFKDIETLEYRLENKKKEIDKIDKKLDKQYELNKIKIKKISNK